MRLSAMQPYFFPYLGYFSLITHSDQFVVFDPVQYIRHGWINRNRILKPDRQTWQYFQVPIAKHSRSSIIRDIRISSGSDWRTRLLGQVEHYRKHAPHYSATRNLLETALSIQTESIVDLNVHCLGLVCNELEISFNPIPFDQIKPPVEAAEHAGQWALNIAKRLGASSYLNPIGGHEIFRHEEFRSAGIELQFLEQPLREYPQSNSSFEAGLSILDVLMFNSREAIRTWLIDDALITSSHRLE